MGVTEDDLPFPPRPRLADHVAARRHLVAASQLVVLHDTRAGGAVVMGEREWGLLRFADGTRAADGIAAAARREGRAVSARRIEDLLVALARAGLLTSGVGEGPPQPSEPLDPQRPLRPLPDFGLRCHGGGSCCRLYPTTTFTSREVAKARVLLPEVLQLGDDPRRAFTPERSSESAPWSPRTVVMVDGRCGLLSTTGRCLLHERGGPLAKPHGCRQFPLTLVDDGRAVQVSVAPECACVLDTADGSDGDPGDPLLAPGVDRAADLHPHTHVDELALELAVDGSERRWSRERYLDWLLQLERTAADPAVDGAALLWAAAAGLGDGASAQVDELSLAAPGGPLLRESAGELRGALGRRLAADGWRAATDLAWRVPRWMLRALDLVDGSEARTQAAVERLYLRTLIHGRTLVPPGERVDLALRARALRLLLARRMSELEEIRGGRAHDPALGQPLALVEAYARAFGVG